MDKIKQTKKKIKLTNWMIAICYIIMTVGGAVTLVTYSDLDKLIGVVVYLGAFIIAFVLDSEVSTLGNRLILLKILNNQKKEK